MTRIDRLSIAAVKFAASIGGNMDYDAPSHRKAMKEYREAVEKVLRKKVGSGA